MLRNKSPVTSGAAGTASVNIATGGSNLTTIATTDDCEVNKDHSLTLTSTSSPQRKLTHRRGFSHGSYASMSQPAAGGHVLAVANYPGTLGRNTGNNSIEVPLPMRNHHSNHSLLNHQPGHSGYHEAPMVKANSNDPMFGTEDFHYSGLVHYGHSSLPQSSSTPNEDMKRAIANIEQKIRKIKKAIAEEQMKCDENVNEYLKLSSNAHSSQSQRIKSVFEKKNQKSTQRIASYQKKLNRYQQEIEDIKERGTYHRPPRERLRDVGTNIKEGITGLSGGVIEGIKSGIHTAGETVIAKPKEFFKRNTADLLTEKNSVEHEQAGSGSGQVLSDSEYPHGSGNSGLLNSNSHSHSHSTKCTSEEDSSSITSESGHLGTGNSHNNSAQLSNNSPLRMKTIRNKFAGINSSGLVEFYTSAEYEQLRSRLDERSQDCLRLNEEVDLLKSQFQTDCTVLNQALQDEKYRVERLEEQLNDLTELHQKEIENLKQTISDLEEKIQYQTEERQRDVHEMLESFQTRISRMEHQQHQHLQQLVNLDSLENSNARALILKLVNVLLTVLQVILLLVATIANILAPFLHTRMRIFTSVIVIIISTFVFQNWPDLSVWAKQKVYENCLYLLGMIPFVSLSDSDGS